MLDRLIRHPEEMDKNTLYELRELVAQYPYHQTARLLLLENLFLLHDESFGEELRRAAFFVPDRRALFRLVEGRNYEIEAAPQRTVAQRVEETGGDRTLGLIEQFLSTLGEGADGTPATAQSPANGTGTTRTDAGSPTNAAATHKPAADPATDYMAYLLQTEGEDAEFLTSPDDDALSLEGLTPSPEATNAAEEAPSQTAAVAPNAYPDAPEPQKDGILTMTLAKIYIKQQRYEEALEIISQVALENPKKSTYFADQIRFLRKLVYAQSLSNA